VLSDKFGAKTFTVGGALLTGASFLLLIFVPVNFSYWEFALVIALNGFGSGLFFAPNWAEMMNSVPAATAGPISHLPPIGVLFASFLGYNPIQQLLGPLLHQLSPAHAAYVTGRQFFPHLITAPFHSGLGVAFGFAIAANVIAAIASALTGRRTPVPATPELLGYELAAVAAEGGFEPSELVVPSGPAAPGAPAVPEESSEPPDRSG
jgi:MFS family permease